MSSIAGSVLPIERAEELLLTLPGVLNARVIAGSTGEVTEVHVLTTTEVSPKQTVRNVESALLANLGMRVGHKKISVATSEGPAAEAIRAARYTPGLGMPVVAPAPIAQPADDPPAMATTRSTKRRLYFEDVEVRRSRASGMSCRVTLRSGDEVYVGEAQGLETDRLRTETAARATIAAVVQADTEGRALAFEGARVIDAFERQFVFVACTTRFGRESALLTGSAEIRDGVETATVLAVLDATNRWVEL
ncbi:MAG: hypothetical protein JWL60_103 [Gemmatimonadetes bacterium]|jgi:hypothetical protein|nr:hypothetical protein [Gemmatimonadota bacterium]